MFTTREQTFIVNCAANSGRYGFPVLACLPGGIVVYPKEN